MPPSVLADCAATVLEIKEAAREAALPGCDSLVRDQKSSGTDCWNRWVAFIC